MMNTAEQYLHQLRKGRVLIHAKERSVARGGVVYRFEDESVLHVGPHVGEGGKDPCRAYPSFDALLANDSLPGDPQPLPWEPYGRYCSMYLDSLWRD